MEKATNTQIGTIGQMYENRKTKKVGVLESRDEKYKTLLFRDANGGSFSIVYSTFRSDWRKYTGDEVVAQTSTQVEEKKEKVKQAERVIEKKPEKTKTKLTHEEKTKAAAALYDIVIDIVEKLDSSLSVKLTSKGCSAVRDGHTNVMQAWVAPTPGLYSLYTDLDMQFTSKVGDVSLEVNDTGAWKLHNRYRMSAVAQAVTEIIQAYLNTKNTKED